MDYLKDKLKRLKAQAEKKPCTCGRCTSRPFTCIEEDYCGNFKEGEETLFRRLVAIPRKCKSQWCKDCRKGHAVTWREKLRPYVKDFPRVSMITLTLDRNLFSSAKQAYELVQNEKKSIGELVKKMKRDGVIEDGRFFYAIEFHKDGYVHWHLAVIPTEKWHGRLNDKRMNGGKMYLAEAWKWGYAHEKTVKGLTPEYAMNYLTKYVMKVDVEPPEWVLNWEGNFRKFSTSRGLCGGEKKKAEPKGGSRERKNAGERIQECKIESSAFVKTETFFMEDGEVKKEKPKFEFIGTSVLGCEELQEHEEFRQARVGQATITQYRTVLAKINGAGPVFHGRWLKQDGGHWVLKKNVPRRNERDYEFRAEEWEPYAEVLEASREEGDGREIGHLCGSNGFLENGDR